MADHPNIECEDAFTALADGLAVLRLLCEAIESTPSELDQATLGRALNVTLRPMEKAAKDLEKKLGLDSDLTGGAHG